MEREYVSTDLVPLVGPVAAPCDYPYDFADAPLAVRPTWRLHQID